MKTKLRYYMIPAVALFLLLFTGARRWFFPVAHSDEFKIEIISPTVSAALQASDARLSKAWTFKRDGWTYIHLEGSPADVGYQHGTLLSAEIADAFNAIKFMDTRRTKRDWNFFRDTAKNVLWPHIDPEYQQELQGIADGLKSKGVGMDVFDVVALNAFEEVPDYYIPWLEAKQKKSGAV